MFIILLILASVLLFEGDIPAAEIDAKHSNADSKFLVMDNGARVHYRDQGKLDAVPLVLVVGDLLVYTRDESVTATVVADKKIEFEGEVASLSRAALTLLHRDGYKWKQANGWAYWMKDGETMGERVERFAPVDEED